MPWKAKTNALEGKNHFFQRDSCNLMKKER
jgi:hypothetical protein